MGQLLEFTSNHPFLVGGILATWAAVMIYEIRLKSQSLTHVSTVDAVRLINNGAIVFDIRSADEYGTGHIVNSKHVDLNEFESNPGTLSKYKKKVILTVCDNGLNSSKAAGTLRKAGFEQTFSIRGGLAGWRKQNMPVHQ